MEITIEEFREQYLPALREKFEDDTSNAILKDGKQITEKLQRQMETFLTVLLKFQQQFPMPVGEIQLSLLRTSVLLGKPQICIAAYDENGVLGNEILNIKFDAAWLFSCWNLYEKAILDEVAGQNGENYVRKAAVKQMQMESVDFLAKLFAVTVKYLFREFDEKEEYGQLLLTDNFMLNAGEYFDWRVVLFQRKPKVDLFFNTEKVPLPYCVFRDAVYNHKSFTGMDLKKTKFIHCEFVHCDFKDVSLNDAIFRDCRMYHCTFENTTFYGATFERVTLKKNHFTRTFWEDKTELETRTDLYKQVEILACEYEGNEFDKESDHGIFFAETE